jgi:hypothetical protein
MILLHGVRDHARRTAGRAERQISRDGRDQRSSRSATGIPEQERLPAEYALPALLVSGGADNAQISHSGAAQATTLTT